MHCRIFMTTLLSSLPSSIAHIGRECKRKNIERRPCIVFNLLDGHGIFDSGSDSIFEPCTGLIVNSGNLIVSSSSGNFGTIILTGSKLRSDKPNMLDTRCNQVRTSSSPTATAAALCAQVVSPPPLRAVRLLTSSAPRFLILTQ